MIIGFSASMGAGKSTAVEKLKDHVDKLELVKFAGPLYEIQELIYDKIASVYTRPKSFVKDRKLLQWIGTDWGRETISNTIWLDLWKTKVNSIRNSSLNASELLIVCDDVRFDNEAELIKSVGGYVVQINCDKNHNRIDTTAGLCNHKSEAGINPKLVDYIISNNGTLKEFELAVRNLYGLISHKERNRL